MKRIFGRRKDTPRTTSLFLEREDTPLMKAVHEKNVDKVKSLLDSSNVDPNLPEGHEKDVPIIAAAYLGSADIVELLVNHKKVDVNKKNNEQCTALYYACVRKFPEVVKVLLSHSDIDVNLPCGTLNSTPLYACIYLGSNECAKVLLNDNRVNINLKTEGKSPFYAAISGRKHDIIVCMFDNFKDKIDFEASNPLDALADSGYFPEENDTIELLEKILDLNFDINAKLEKHTNFLTFICKQGNSKALQMLLDDKRLTYPKLGGKKGLLSEIATNSRHNAEKRTREIVKILCADEKGETEEMIEWFKNDIPENCSHVYKVNIGLGICESRGISPGEFIEDDKVLEDIMKLADFSNRKAKKPAAS